MSNINYMWRITKEDYRKTNPWHVGYTNYQECLQHAINSSFQPSPLINKLGKEEIPFEIIKYEIKETKNFITTVSVGDTPTDISIKIDEKK